MKLLSSSLRLARIRGVEIRFHFSMLLSIPIAYLLFRPNNFREAAGASLWLLGLISSVLLHELGHAFAAQLVLPYSELAVADVAHWRFAS